MSSPESEPQRIRHSWKSLVAAFLPVILICAFIYWLMRSFIIINGGGHSPDHVAQNEIHQLTVSLSTFEDRLGCQPPSRIKLSETFSYTDDPLDLDSEKFISRMFPRMDATKGIDWNGNSKIETPADGGDVVLEGDQCLVFFLGGPPPHMDGFPAKGDFLNKATLRTGPFFLFRSARLVRLHGNDFCSYLDPFGAKPYAFFSSYQKNNYNKYKDSDCTMLNVWPYAASLSPKTYYNRNTFQILSAGADGRFGQGTRRSDPKIWTPETADQIDADGRDDLSNFYGQRLGTVGD